MSKIKIGSEDDAISLRFEITSILREELGLHERFASTLAEPIVNGLRKKFSGHEIYIAKTQRSDISERNSAIRLEFNGRNLKEMMCKYKLSKSALYKIAGRK